MKSIISRVGEQNRKDQKRSEQNRGDQDKIHLSFEKEK